MSKVCTAALRLYVSMEFLERVGRVKLQPRGHIPLYYKFPISRTQQAEATGPYTMRIKYSEYEASHPHRDRSADLYDHGPTMMLGCSGLLPED